METQGDINAKATAIGSEDGKVALIAKGENSSINIKDGRHTESLDIAYLIKDKGLVNNKTTQDRYSSHSDKTIGSEIDGKEVVLSATEDINLTAVQVVSDDKTIVKAGRDINIGSSQDISTTTHEHDTKKSGLMTTGGLGVSIGSEKRGKTTHKKQ